MSKNAFSVGNSAVVEQPERGFRADDEPAPAYIGETTGNPHTPTATKRDNVVRLAANDVRAR